jgi:hypothetical protein
LSPLPVVHVASKSKDINGVMNSVMQIMPELQEICGEAASLKMVSSGTSVVADITDVVPMYGTISGDAKGVGSVRGLGGAYDTVITVVGGVFEW